MKVHLSIPKIVTVEEDVVVTIPDGWEVVAVGRHPLAGEKYFHCDPSTGTLQLNRTPGERLACDVAFANMNIPPHGYIIVKKKSRKVFTFTETGEVRKAQPGEYYMCPEGEVNLAKGWATTSAYPIFTRTVTEI